MTHRTSAFLLRQLLGCVALLAVAALAVADEASDSARDQLADEIHQSGLLFDGHNDLPWQIRKLAGGSFDQMDIAQPQPKLHTDIPKLKRSGLKAQFWSVYVSADTMQTGDSLLRTLEQIELVHEMLRRYPETFTLAKSADDIEPIARSGKIASMLGVEGGYSMDGELSNLKRFHDRGVRYMTLTHSKTIDWADSCGDKPRSGGLSPFGEEVVREMNRLGMLVDLSHVSDETMDDALRVTKAPVVFSHSSVRSICDKPRNVPDEILKRVPENGGVVMVNFMSGFVVPTAELAKDKKTRGTVATVVDHIEHVIKLAGVDHVGLGGDYDGVENLPIGLEDVSGYPNITRELVRRGYTKEQIHKILGGNILRVLRAAEDAADAR